MNNIDVIVENIESPEWIDRIDFFVGNVLKLLIIDNWELSITFCDDKFIHNLNKKYRGKDSATDVLTFAQNDDPFPVKGIDIPLNAGDIIISLDTLTENAEYFDEEKEVELKRLIIHGLLHLNGMDHSDNSPKQEMLVFQEKILNKLTEVKIF